MNLSDIETFKEYIKFDQPIKDGKILIYGYFPYETARVSNTIPKIPSNFLFINHGIFDNKFVIICQSESDEFAVFYRDNSVSIGKYENIQHYDVCKELELKVKFPDTKIYTTNIIGISGNDQSGYVLLFESFFNSNNNVIKKCGISKAMYINIESLLQNNNLSAEIIFIFSEIIPQVRKVNILSKLTETENE